MTSDKLSQWINKVCPGGRSLVLAHDQAIGMPLVVATWTKEDIDEAREANRSIGAAVIEAATDHADSVNEGCGFTLSWRNDTGGVIRAIKHKQAPTDTETSESALHAAFVSPNATIGQLLSHISQQQRVINGSIGAVLAAYERALVMQQKVIDATTQQLVVLQGAASKEPSEYETHLLSLKEQALGKALELLPTVTETIMGAVAARVLGPGTEAAATTATAAAAAGAATEAAAA